MRIQSWYATVGIVALTSIAGAACTSTTTDNNPGDDASTLPTDDAGDGAVAVTPDAGDAGLVVADAGDAGDAVATTCGVGLDTGSADCDTCVTTSCCSQLTTCDTTDDAGVDDAGFSACEDLLGCINSFDSTTDAGVDAGAGESACDPSYTADEQTNAEAVLTCIRTSCATQCPGL